MKKIKSALKAISITPWFIKESWHYITTKKFSSKIDFFIGVFPAWIKFTTAAYKDNQSFGAEV